jgi:hypothetical protein
VTREKEKAKEVSRRYPKKEKEKEMRSSPNGKRTKETTTFSWPTKEIPWRRRRGGNGRCTSSSGLVHDFNVEGRLQIKDG